MKDQKLVLSLLAKVKRLAKEYYELTGRPLGVTAEIGEYEAANLLGLQLADVRHPGYDAVSKGPPKEGAIPNQDARRPAELNARATHGAHRP